jgi:hypothetical protein
LAAEAFVNPLAPVLAALRGRPFPAKVSLENRLMPKMVVAALFLCMQIPFQGNWNLASGRMIAPSSIEIS